MKRPNLTRWLASAVAGLALALSGCGEVPSTAPAPTPSDGMASSSPEILRLSGTTAYFGPAPNMEVQAAGSVNASATTASLKVNGSVGGRLSCGRFTVVVPPNSFSGTGTVSMSLRDTTVAVVDLNITPATLNNFKSPVALSYDPSGLGLTDPVTIYFYDSNRRVWIDLLARVDSKTGLPTVQLKHFSPYGAGKAGW